MIRLRRSIGGRIVRCEYLNYGLVGVGSCCELANMVCSYTFKKKECR